MASLGTSSTSTDQSQITPRSKDLLFELVEDIKNKGLVLFLGSGINGSAVPQWNALLTMLLDKSLHWIEHEDRRIQKYQYKLAEWCNQNFGMSAQASIVKKLFGAERYRLEIQNILYSNTQNVEHDVEEFCRKKRSRKKLAEYNLLYQVAQLCSSPHVKAVATFNFDTLLETALKTIGKRRPQPHYGDVDSTRYPQKELNDIPIYHVHGRLPGPSFYKNLDDSIVMSYDEYFDKNADPLSWETATSIHLLRHYCTLWIGSSLKDWNMLRLLHGALSGRKNIRSYCIQCLDDIQVPKKLEISDTDKNEFQKAAMRIQASLLETVSVRLILAGPRYADIPQTIKQHISMPLKKSTQGGENK